MAAQAASITVVVETRIWAAATTSGGALVAISKRITIRNATINRITSEIRR